MKKAMIAPRWLWLLLLTQLTACGLKGPLYMPQEKPKAQADMIKETLPTSAASAISAAKAG